MRNMIKGTLDFLYRCALAVAFLVVGGMLMSFLYGNVELVSTGKVAPTGIYED